MPENRYKYVDDNKEHCHMLDGKVLFGASTIVKVINKPLTWWAAGESLKRLGWTKGSEWRKGKKVFFPVEPRLQNAEEYLAEIRELSTEDYLALLDDAYRAHDETKKTAGTKGTDRHALLEKYVKFCMEHGGTPVLTTGTDSEWDVEEPIKEFTRWAVQNVKQFLWSEKNCYSEQGWYGGIADVGWLDMQDRVIAADFKSSKEAYSDQFMQIAGYDLALSENGGFDKDGNKTFDLPAPIKGYCVVPFGAETLTPNFQYDVESFRKGFKAALVLHKLITQFD